MFPIYLYTSFAYDMFPLAFIMIRHYFHDYFRFFGFFLKLIYAS